MRVALVTRPKPDTSGAVPLYVRLAHGGKDRYVALGLRVQPKDWNPRRGEVRRSHPDARRFQELLAERLRTAERAANALIGQHGRYVSADEVKEAIAAELHPSAEAPSAGVLAYGRAQEAEMRASGRIGNANVYRTTLRHFKETLPLAGFARGDVPFDAIDPSLLRRHEARLQSEGYRQNYVAKQLRTLRAILRRAKVDGIPGAAAAVEAVSTIRVRTERVEKPRLTHDEVRKLEQLVGTVHGRRADALDWWLFAFYAGGMRFGDVATLRWSGVEWKGEPGKGGEPVYVRWRMRKTGDAAGLPILLAAAEVLKRWWPRTGMTTHVFGMLTDDIEQDATALFKTTASFNALARSEMKSLSTRAGVPYVGFHGARHSLADTLRKRGVPLATISQILGHSSIQVTQNYLSSFDRDAVEEALRGLE